VNEATLDVDQWAENNWRMHWGNKRRTRGSCILPHKPPPTPAAARRSKRNLGATAKPPIA